MLQLDAFLSALGVLDDDTDVDEDIGIQTNPKLTLPESFPSLSLIFALTPYTSAHLICPDFVTEPVGDFLYVMLLVLCRYTLFLLVSNCCLYNIHWNVLICIILY